METALHATTRTVTTEQLDEFLGFAQQVSDADYFKFMPERMDMAPVLEFDTITGRNKFARIWAINEVGHKSAWGFLNLHNGDVLKADGWKKPALNFARGNINDNAHGTERIKWTGVG